MAVFGDEKEPKFHKKGKKVELTLRGGRKIRVEELGQDYFGKIKGREIWCPIYSYDAIYWLVDEIKYAIKNEWDQVMLIAGRERSGKSDLGMHLAYGLDPEYPLSEITFTQRQFKYRVQDAAPGSVLIMDEGGEVVFAHEWMERGQRDLVKAFLRFGIKKLKTIIILPHIMLLNKQLRERRVHWWIEVYAKDLDERGYAQVRKAPLKQDPFKTDIFWKGLFTLRFPAFKKTQPKKWREYEAVKIAHLDRPRDDSDKVGAEKTKQIHQRIVDACKNLRNTGWNDTQIADLFKYSKRNVRDIMQRGTVE